MNKKRYILLALILLTMSLGMTAKNKTVQKIYLYGFSASFKDSMVYFTDIQELENVSVAERTGFLYGRDSTLPHVHCFLCLRPQAHREEVSEVEVQIHEKGKLRCQIPQSR